MQTAWRQQGELKPGILAVLLLSSVEYESGESITRSPCAGPSRLQLGVAFVSLPFAFKFKALQATEKHGHLPHKP